MANHPNRSKSRVSLSLTDDDIDILIAAVHCLSSDHNATGADVEDEYPGCADLDERLQKARSDVRAKMQSK